MIKITDQLYYRKIEEADLPSRVAWLNDPLINDTLTFDVPVSLEGTQEWFKRSNQDASKLNLTFFEKLDGDFRPIGFGGFINIDRKNARAELYITIGERNAQGKGYALPLVNQICEIGFNELELHKIYLSTLEHNLRALSLYKKSGFVEEGFFKEHFLHKGTYKGAYYMAKFNK